MQITLTQITPDPENEIGLNASICYDSAIDREANIRRAAACVERGHLTTLRFAHATVNVKGISRICSHQIVRMAHAGILQRSQRYVSESAIAFIRPPVFEALPAELKARWAALEQESRDLYNLLVDAKHMHREDARYTLLHSAETEMNLCLNFQGWVDVLKNRTAKSAQWEVREVMQEVARQLAEHAPHIFSRFLAKV